GRNRAAVHPCRPHGRRTDAGGRAETGSADAGGPGRNLRAYGVDHLGGRPPVDARRQAGPARGGRLMAAFVGTANPGYAAAAMEEVRRADPKVRMKGLSPDGDAFLIEAPDAPDGGEAAWMAMIRKREPVFLRHLFPVHAEADLLAGEEAAVRSVAGFAASLSGRAQGRKIAMKFRKSPDSPLSLPAAREAASEALAAAGAEIVPRDANWILSGFASKNTLYLGVSRPEDNLSDWPGGAMRFRREEGLVSRAAFKLLEAERTFRLPLDRTVHGVELGAAPGGGASGMLRRGAGVTAADPAELHPSPAGDPRLRHIRRNAAEVSFPPGSFDLLLCDISRDPLRTCRIVCSH